MLRYQVQPLRRVAADRTSPDRSSWVSTSSTSMSGSWPLIKPSGTAQIISCRSRVSFSGGMSGRLLPIAPIASSRMRSVHFAWTSPVCAMRISRSR